MSSTTISTRSGRVIPGAVTTIVTALAVAAVAVLAFLAISDVVGGQAVPTTTPVDGSGMPVPRWLELYLDPPVASGGSVDPASPTSATP